jgi:hypothetical protein
MCVYTTTTTIIIMHQNEMKKNRGLFLYNYNTIYVRYYFFSFRTNLFWKLFYGLGERKNGKLVYECCGLIIMITRWRWRHGLTFILSTQMNYASHSAPPLFFCHSLPSKHTHIFFNQESSAPVFIETAKKFIDIILCAHMCVSIFDLVRIFLNSAQ